MYKTEVILSKKAEKDLSKLPYVIEAKLWAWVDSVKHSGLRDIRKLSGYHDEPLKGDRKGQRSIRLNRAYRAIYRADESSQIELVEILEVNKHDY